MKLMKKISDRLNVVTAISTRKCVAAGCLLFIGAPSFAQSGFDFGLKGFLGTSSLLNSTDQAAGPELDYKNSIKIAGGISGGYNFNKHIGVELNVLYAKQGQSYKGEVSQITPSANGALILSDEFASLAAYNNVAFSGNYTADISTTCIKIPVLFRYTGDNTKGVYFSSFIGPQIDILNSANVQVNGQSVSLAAYNIKEEDLYKKTTVDAVLGLGVGINLPANLVLSAHLRFDYGLGDVENKSETVSAFGSSVRVYSSERAATNNATGGLLISLNYKLVKKPVTKSKTHTVSKTKS